MILVAQIMVLFFQFFWKYFLQSLILVFEFLAIWKFFFLTQQYLLIRVFLNSQLLLKKVFQIQSVFFHQLSKMDVFYK